VILPDLVKFSERAYGDPSLQLFAALANVRGLNLRAHKVDAA
jgi:hypothetical protein